MIKFGQANVVVLFGAFVEIGVNQLAHGGPELESPSTFLRKLSSEEPLATGTAPRGPFT